MRRIFFIIIAFLTMTFTTVSADTNAYKNTLVKVDAIKNTQGKLNITIYTTKPYSDILTVNAKPNNTYVIYLPETANQMTVKPSISQSSGLLKDIEIKSTPYGTQPGKGYTKITLTANRPITISTSSKVATVPTKIQENELKQLIAETKKPAIQKNTTKKVETEKKQQNTVSQPIAKKTIQKQQPTQNKTAVQQTQQTAKKVEQPITKESATVEDNPQNSIMTPEEPQSTEQVQQPIQQDTDPTLAQKVPEQPQKANNFEELFAHNNTAAVIFVIALILLFTMLLRMAKKFVNANKLQIAEFQAHLAEKPNKEPKDYTDIAKDEKLSWKEKYKSFKRASDREDFHPQVQEINIDENDKLIIDDDFQDPELKEKDSQQLDALFTDKSFDSEDFENSEYIKDTNEIEFSRESVEDIEEEFETSNDSDVAHFDTTETQIETQNEITQEIEGQTIDENIVNSDKTDENNELSIDEIFGDDEDEEFSLENIAQTKNYSTNPLEVIYDMQSKNEDIDINEDSDIDNTLASISESTDDEIEEENENGFIAKSKYSINDNSGFYLVDVDNKSALIGYINEEIFVLKQFDIIIDKPIQARYSNEGYIVRIGNYKLIVDVSENDMKIAIEL